MTIPAIAGPITQAALNVSWLSPIAAWSRSVGTRRGTADARAGPSIAPRLVDTNITT
jgi:hypothetical protein